MQHLRMVELISPPNIVTSVFDRNGEMLKEFGKRVKEEIEIDLDFRNRVLRGLVGVTEDIEGTAYWAFNSVATDGAFFPLENFPTAAKTGTAEVRGKADSSVFAAMTPAQDPDYVMVVMLEEAGFGSAVAAPMSARVLQKGSRRQGSRSTNNRKSLCSFGFITTMHRLVYLARKRLVEKFRKF